MAVGSTSSLKVAGQEMVVELWGPPRGVLEGKMLMALVYIDQREVEKHDD